MTHLFIHGLGQTAAAWDGVLRHMAALPDVRGVNLPPLLQGRKADYETLSGEFDALCGGIQGPLALCGLSLGAVLALDYTLRHPERVDSLALIAPQYRMPRLTLKLQSAAFRRMPERAFASTGFRKAEFLSLTASMAALDFPGRSPASPAGRCSWWGRRIGPTGRPPGSWRNSSRGRSSSPFPARGMRPI